MKIKVKLHPGSSQEKILKLDEKNFEVWISERAIDGKANDYLEKFLKKEFGVKCRIVSGLTSRLKTIEIID